VNQTGGGTYPEASPEWSLEISLDLDMVSAACPKCHILLVEANNNSLEDPIAENEAAALGATEISNSYAAREILVGRAGIEEYGKYYTEHSGTRILVASGDNGYNNEQFETEYCGNCSPSFPAGLSSVVSVGGTEVKPEGETGRGWGETVWFYSGGGCTLHSAKPSWQSDKGCANRTDNDVAAEAPPRRFRCMICIHWWFQAGNLLAARARPPH
jgi:subtilase family serine protease